MTAAVSSATINLRLRRLRRRLLLVATVIAAIGLALLARLVIQVDNRARSDQLTAELDRRAATARSLIYYDDERLRLDGLRDDEAINGSPQVFVVTSEGQLVFTHRELDFGLDPVIYARQVDDGHRDHDTAPDAGDGTDSESSPDTDGGGEEVEEVVVVDDAALALGDTAERPLVVEATDDDDRTARVLVRHFHHDVTGELAGAVVVIGDIDYGMDEHRALVRTVTLAALSLLAGLVLTIRLVITQSLAPSATALAQQERFLADAAHELRKPLTSLRAVAERALAGGGEAAALDRSIEIVSDASTMLDDLLALARMDVGGPGRTAVTEPVRLDQLVESLLADRPDVRVWADQAVVADVDPSLVERAVTNLVDNAFQHGEPPVDVVVEAGTVRVLDRGPGFPDGGGEVYFERFRTDRGAGGTGIGLALVAAVARVHGGWVDAANRSDGPGAEMTIGFP